MTNHSTDTKIELGRLRINSAEEAYSFLSEQENLILSEVKLGNITTRENPTSLNRNSRSNLKDKQNTNKKKWCSFHKVNSHTDKECYAQKTNQKKQNFNTKSFAFMESPIKVPPIELDGNVSNKNVKVLLDSGTGYNFIRKSIAECLNLEIITTKPMKLEMFDRHSIMVNTKISTLLCLVNFPNMEFKVSFYLVEDIGIDIVLGTQFFIEQELIMDFKNKLITINNLSVEIPMTTDCISANDPDLKIIEKSKIYVSVESHHKQDFNNEESNEMNNQKISSPVLTNEDIPDDIKSYIQEKIINNPKLGHIPYIKHKIDLNEKPVNSAKFYRVPLNLQIPVEDLLHHLKDLGIIEPSYSTFTSPAFPILKANGEVRLVVDYRKLNTYTHKHPYPLPNMNDLIATFNGATVFSNIDLTMGYYQIELEKESRKYTAFTINNRQFQFIRLPFGLKNAPMFFQKAMNTLFEGVEFVKIYLDDIIIFSPSIQEHKNNLKFVLKKLQDNGVGINFSKSHFFKKEINFLGHIINANGIKPNLKRISQISSYINPKSIKDLQKLLGFLNWFRPYLKDLSTNLIFITNKLSSKNKFT